VLADTKGPAVVVPAFLAPGYHVNTDLPARIAESGHRRVTVTRALGPDPVLAAIMRTRLLEAGWSPGDAVVMAAAGSSDPVARCGLMRAANLLADMVGEVHLGFIAQAGAATGVPAVADLVGRLCRSGGAGVRRVLPAGARGVPRPAARLRCPRGGRTARRPPGPGGTAGPAVHPGRPTRVRDDPFGFVFFAVPFAGPFAGPFVSAALFGPVVSRAAAVVARPVSCPGQAPVQPTGQK
jgi:hypothetical protein